MNLHTHAYCIGTFEGNEELDCVRIKSAQTLKTLSFASSPETCDTSATCNDPHPRAKT